MLGLNAVRLLAGIRASWFTLILGTIALLAGIGSVLGIDIPVGPILIILIGLADHRPGLPAALVGAVPGRFERPSAAGECAGPSGT